MASVVPKEVKKEIVDAWVAEPTWKVALLTGYTFVNGHDEYTDVSAWEVVGTGYTAGGATLAGRATVADGTEYNLDATDLTWTGVTLTNVNFACAYYTATDKIRSLHDLGGSFSVVGGSFTLQWDTDGLIKVS